MAWIGLLPVIAGIAAVIWKAKHFKKIVLWLFLVVVVLEAASYVLFSKIASEGVPFILILVGLALGVFLGKSNKLVKKREVIFYKQNLFLSLIYLGFFLANQLTAALFNAYIPLLLMLGALAMGVQIGFLLMTLFLAVKPKKAPLALVFLLCLTCLFPLGTVNATEEEKASEGEAAVSEEAAVEPSIMDITPAELGVTGVEEGNKTAYDELSGGNLGTSLIFDKGKVGNSENGRAFQGGSVRYFNYYRVAPPPGGIYQYGVDGCTVRSYYGYEIYKEGTTEDLLAKLEVNAVERQNSGCTVNSIQIGKNKVFRIYEAAGPIEGVTYMAAAENTLFTIVYTYTTPVAPPIEAVETYSPPKMTVEQLDALFGAWTKRILGSEEFAAEKNSGKEGEETEEASSGMEKKSGEQKASPVGGIIDGLTHGKGLLEFVPLDSKDGFLANLIGGLLAGAGMILFSVLTVLPKGLSMMEEEAEEEEAGPAFEISKIQGIGMRREDGKFWTKNHGWQDEEVPAVQVEKLDRLLEKLKEEIEKATRNEDKMMVELLGNEKMRCERERLSWIQDHEACKKTKYEEEQSETEEQNIPTEIYWNYKMDLGTMAEKGTLKELSKEKKKVTTKPITMRIIEKAGVLSEEMILPDIHIISEPANSTRLAEAGVEEALNAEIIRNTGKNIQALERAFGFEKAKLEGCAESLKEMIAGAEAFAESLRSKKAKE